MKRKVTGRTNLSVTISRDLRRELDEAREDSDWKTSVFRKHTLSAEVEELLRIALKARASGNFLTLQIDDGLWAWLKAHVDGIGLAGGMEDTAIFLIRNQINKDFQSEGLRRMMLPHLPPSIQKALAA